MNKIKDIYSIKEKDNVLITVKLVNEKGDYRYDVSTLQSIYDNILKQLESNGFKGAFTLIPDDFSLKTFDKETLLIMRDQLDQLIEAL